MQGDPTHNVVEHKYTDNDLFTWYWGQGAVVSHKFTL